MILNVIINFFNEVSLHKTTIFDNLFPKSLQKELYFVSNRYDLLFYFAKNYKGKNFISKLTNRGRPDLLGYS